MIVVNLFGAPGAGKSTGAAYIFAKLKMAGINAELVTEFAKDKVWEEYAEVFKNQAYTSRRDHGSCIQQWSSHCSISSVFKNSISFLSKSAFSSMSGRFR